MIFLSKKAFHPEILINCIHQTKESQKVVHFWGKAHSDSTAKIKDELWKSVFLAATQDLLLTLTQNYRVRVSSCLQEQSDVPCREDGKCKDFVCGYWCGWIEIEFFGSQATATGGAPTGHSCPWVPEAQASWAGQPHPRLPGWDSHTTSYAIQLSHTCQHHC